MTTFNLIVLENFSLLKEVFFYQKQKCTLILVIKKISLLFIKELGNFLGIFMSGVTYFQVVTFCIISGKLMSIMEQSIL